MYASGARLNKLEGFQTAFCNDSEAGELRVAIFGPEMLSVSG